MKTVTRGDTVHRLMSAWERPVSRGESRDGPPLTEDELIGAYRSIRVEIPVDRRQHREVER